ncbi:MAG: hypothetical protein ACPG6P_11960 [Akkermansiaceae bacterium]
MKIICSTLISFLCCSALWAQRAPTTPAIEPSIDEDLLAPLLASGTHEKKDEKSSLDTPPVTMETQDEGITLGVTKPDDKAANPAKIMQGDVKIKSPWPAKPLSSPPFGWKLAPAPEGTPVHRETVTLKTGERITLSITPYILVPDSDGRTSFTIAEPGYHAPLGLQQKDTVTAVLERSNIEIEKAEKQTAEAIRRLQLLLTSLPKDDQ